jgi:hypothetical protein
MNHYLLDANGDPVFVPDVIEWARGFSADQQRVAKTTVGVVDVSTVFLGTDHNFAGSGPPVLFETMIFGGEHDQAQWRYTTRAEAEAEHARIVAALQAGETP